MKVGGTIHVNIIKAAFSISTRDSKQYYTTLLPKIHRGNSAYVAPEYASDAHGTAGAVMLQLAKEKETTCSD